MITVAKPPTDKKPDYEKMAKSEREAEVARQREFARTTPAMLIWYETRADSRVKMRRVRPSARRKLMAAEAIG